ncbi:MAG TPA: thrombospondin type 3 repeat-containing protein, partial [Candidatus Thermoplasmatota archaeon]|nr:thrombospondin type 3 repeat-containing protein [Candidatus Thermoplasmatota archaeon]
EMVGTAHVDLYFMADVSSLTIFEVRVYRVAADGTPFLLGSQARQFVTALSPDPQSFEVPIDGQLLPRGEWLLVEVYAQTSTAAFIMQYDAAATPSALQLLEVRPLDSDGDGIPDDSDACALNPDCDGDGIPDGRDDTDGDGLPDYVEYRFYTTYDVTNPDSDGDGVPDGAEDCDSDGLSNAEEVARGTEVCDADTDGDGILDPEDSEPGTAAAAPAGDSAGTGISWEPVAAGGVFAASSAGVLLLLMRRF